MYNSRKKGLGILSMKPVLPSFVDTFWLIDFHKKCATFSRIYRVILIQSALESRNSRASISTPNLLIRHFGANFVSF